MHGNNRSQGSKKIELKNNDIHVSKIPVDGDYRHEIRRQLFLDSKAMTNLDSVLKNKDVTLLTKVHKVKAIVFPVVIY